MIQAIISVSRCCPEKMATLGGAIVVLDNGGHTCKAGFAGEADPKR